MKKFLLIAVACVILGSCKNSQNQQKAVVDDIMNTHEKVMNNEDDLMRNKMKIDTLLKQNLQPDVKSTATALNQKLVQADDAMSAWMQKFNPDFKGKNDDESLNYFKDQRTQVMKVDSQMKAVIQESNTFLSHQTKK